VVPLRVTLPDFRPSGVVAGVNRPGAIVPPPPVIGPTVPVPPRTPPESTTGLAGWVSWTARVPAFTVVFPVYVFGPSRTSTPAPSLVRFAFTGPPAPIPSFRAAVTLSVPPAATSNRPPPRPGGGTVLIRTVPSIVDASPGAGPTVTVTSPLRKRLPPTERTVPPERVTPSIAWSNPSASNSPSRSTDDRKGVWNGRRQRATALCAAPVPSPTTSGPARAVFSSIMSFSS